MRLRTLGPTSDPLKSVDAVSDEERTVAVLFVQESAMWHYVPLDNAGKSQNAFACTSELRELDATPGQRRANARPVFVSNKSMWS